MLELYMFDIKLSFLLFERRWQDCLVYGGAFLGLDHLKDIGSDRIGKCGWRETAIVRVDQEEYKEC